MKLRHFLSFFVSCMLIYAWLIVSTLEEVKKEYNACRDIGGDIGYCLTGFK